MSPTIDVFFASHDGQTRQVADRIYNILQETGANVSKREIKAGNQDIISRCVDVTVVAAPIRYGFPLRIADKFLRRNVLRIDQSRFALVLVNLTARRPGRTTPAGNIYLRRWLTRQRLNPAIACAVAGRVDYPNYKWYDRIMMQLILTISGGPTDSTTSIEYTDWQQVERLAGDIFALAAKAASRAS